MNLHGKAGLFQRRCLDPHDRWRHLHRLGPGTVGDKPPREKSAATEDDKRQGGSEEALHERLGNVFRAEKVRRDEETRRFHGESKWGG
jgi:hypothetical protein